MAAWKYACMPKNGVSSGVKAKIKNFAKEHFGADLHEGDDARKSLRRSKAVFKCRNCGHEMHKCPECGM